MGPEQSAMAGTEGTWDMEVIASRNEAGTLRGFGGNDRCV